MVGGLSARCNGTGSDGVPWCSSPYLWGVSSVATNRHGFKTDRCWPCEWQEDRASTTEEEAHRRRIMCRLYILRRRPRAQLGQATMDSQLETCYLPVNFISIFLSFGKKTHPDNATRQHPPVGYHPAASRLQGQRESILTLRKTSTQVKPHTGRKRKTPSANAKKLRNTPSFITWTHPPRPPTLGPFLRCNSTLTPAHRVLANFTGTPNRSAMPLTTTNCSDRIYELLDTATILYTDRPNESKQKPQHEECPNSVFLVLSCHPTRIIS